MSSFIYLNSHNSLLKKFHQLETSKLQSLVAVELIILFAITIIIATQGTFGLHSQALAYEHPLTPSHEIPAVLGVNDEITPTQTPIPPQSTQTEQIVITPTEAPSPTPRPSRSHRKNEYSIAIYGDSMVDTMGEKLEYLEHSMKKLYPDVNITFYNYGKGSENVEMGLSRWNNKLDYQDRHYPSISDLKPDIIIIGSFAYNPFSPHIRDRHWVGLTKLVETAKNITPNVYMLAEIAPLRKNFGKGPDGVNWDENTAYEHSGRIIEQLENTVSLSSNLHVGLIDVFHASIGKIGLNNPGDGIHASVFGHEFTADKIAETISLN